MAEDNLPPLPKVSIPNTDRLEAPSLKIRTEEDVTTWKSTKGYQNYMLFLRRLSESVVGRSLPQSEQDCGNKSSAVTSMLVLLERLDNWIDEIPPLPTPQRFGNLAFRTWGKKLEDNAKDLMLTLLPTHLHKCTHLLTPYLLISFGSFTRMDYGTGHEAAFGLFLLCLSFIRFFEPAPEEERSLVLVIFARYLRLCWRLQDVYRLEPAGSHGVWGLDDSSFLGYIFGSGQLKGQTDISVSSVLHPPLPPTNLYFLSISRIHEVKHGPFHEHSSQLYAIATGVPNWEKVHSGLLKMYEAEVLGKRVVVQHIPVGGLLEWNANGSSISSSSSSAAAAAAAASTSFRSPGMPEAGTRAPWVSGPAPITSTFPSPPMGTGAPWVGVSANRTRLPLLQAPTSRTLVPLPTSPSLPQSSTPRADARDTIDNHPYSESTLR
ncbi:Phosphotyrosyl phosphatase activator [Phellopilus nigrolimitatus]|nr:Phosphotyrosyl phosphatase activator [Phellopilus nigrolimitatus]